MERDTETVSQPGPALHPCVKKTGIPPWIFMQKAHPKIKGLSTRKLKGGVGEYVRSQRERRVEPLLCHPDKQG